MAMQEPNASTRRSVVEPVSMNEDLVTLVFEGGHFYWIKNNVTTLKVVIPWNYLPLEGALKMDLPPAGTLADLVWSASENEIAGYDIQAQSIIAYSIAWQIEQLHKESWIHGNVTPSNVMMDQFLHPTLLSFEKMDLDKESRKIHELTFVKTAFWYRPPELKSSAKFREFCDEWQKLATEKERFRYQASIDVYMFGMLMYELFTGLSPASKVVRDMPRGASCCEVLWTKDQVCDQIYGVQELVFDDPKRPETCSSLMSLVKGCINEEPEHRPDIETVRQELYEFAKDVVDDVQVLDGYVKTLDDMIARADDKGDAHGTRENLEACAKRGITWTKRICEAFDLK